MVLPSCANSAPPKDQMIMRVGRAAAVAAAAGRARSRPPRFGRVERDGLAVLRELRSAEGPDDHADQALGIVGGTDGKPEAAHHGGLGMDGPRRPGGPPP